MTEKNKQSIKEGLNLLPKEMQDAVSSFDWVKTSEEIGKRHFFSEEEVNVLQAEVGIVLIGIENRDFLALNIEGDIGTSKEEAEKISSEIVEKILNPIVEILTRNIRMGLKNKSVHWQQNLDFILSGGDYTAFIREPKKETKLGIEDKGTSTTFNQSKLDDLKSKFTI